MTTFTADGSQADADVPTTDDVFSEPTKHEVVKAAPAEPSVEVAVRDEVKDIALAAAWPHDYLQFEGDKLEIRLPTEQALSAFSISVSKYMPAEVQNDMVGLFIAKHMSVESYTHVMARMMDPDDTTYTKQTVGQLMGAISKAAVEYRKSLEAADDKSDEAP